MKSLLQPHSPCYGQLPQPSPPTTSACEPPSQGQPGPASPPAGAEIRPSENAVLSAVLALSQANVSHRPGGESDVIISNNHLESALMSYKPKVNY